jgi:N-methylhydantoinase B
MAEARYGVVIAGGGVDAGATAALRATMRQGAHTTHFHFGPERDAFEGVWDARNYDALTGLLSALPVHWRFFVKTKVFAAIRDAENAGSVATAFAAVRRNYPQVPEILPSAA